MRGVVAAGHPLTAEAGAEVLREGGNAVDAAACSVLTSFALESPLTGFGAGGFMLVHTPAGETVLIDFFVDAPGREGTSRAQELVPIDVYFDPSTPQVFNVGAASCGVPGTAAGLERALERFGTMPASELVAPGIRHAREGVPINRQQAFVFEILAPIYALTAEAREIYAPEGRMLREGETFRFPDLAEALERFAADGADPFYGGEIGHAVADFVAERGGTLSRADMEAYRPIERQPVSAGYRECEILTNPPPSSGGILIAYSLGLLERLGRSDVEALVAVMQAANETRGEEFSDGLRDERFGDRFLDAGALDRAAERIRAGLGAGGPASDPGDAFGSTTHLAAIDAEGYCASVTCSNGTGSSILVPGTGVHVNNMLGEEDLNPHGFHLTPVGARLPSMMSPTVVLRDGEVVAGLGSAGSNRIRSAVLQTVVRMLADGMGPEEAIAAARVHFEAGVVQAEPGVDAEGLDAVERRGLGVNRWDHQNLFFGGVQAVARDPVSGELSGAGDPRRGGAAVSA